MQVKMTQFRLDNYYYNQETEIKPGVHVCPANGCTSVGTIVDVGPIVEAAWGNSKEPEWVRVLWGTGKKRGKLVQHELNTLSMLTSTEKPSTRNSLL